MQARNARSTGFTLIEAMIVLAFVALLVGVAVPAWSSASESAHAGAAQAALLESLVGAIDHAALNGSEVVMCPGDASGCRDSIDWSRGWVAWADLDGDRTLGSGEPLLQTHPPLSGAVHLRSTGGRKHLVFQPSGGNVGSNVTFTLCDGRGPSQARALVLANDGRLHSSQASAAAAAACMLPL